MIKIEKLVKLFLTDEVETTALNEIDVHIKKGEFVSPFAPYGYKIDPNNKGKLIIDEEAGVVVQRIYGLYLNGGSMCGIARQFNDEGLPCPTKHKNKTTTYKNAAIKRYLWTQETIRWILTNPTYAGNLTQRRQEKINYKVEKFRKIPPEDWIIVKGTHEPLINQKDFDFTQDLIQKKIQHYNMPEKAFHLLNGLVFCKECGMKMTYRRNKSKKMCFVCATYSKFGVAHCASHQINEEFVETYILNELRKVAEKSLGEDFYNQFEERDFAEPEPGNTAKDNITCRLSEIKNIIKSLYNDKLRGIIDEELFIEMSGQFNGEKIKLTDKLARIDKQMSTPVKKYDFKSIIKKIANFEVIERNILVRLIDRIEISKDKEIFIIYNFCEPAKTA